MLFISFFCRLFITIHLIIIIFDYSFFRDFLRRNIVYYQKIKSNPSLAFLLQSALTNIFSEFSNFASENSCVKPNNSNNNGSNNTSSNNYGNFNPDMDDHNSPNSKDFPDEDERNVKNPA
jgi:hypothetical protein